jgi:hypothetical protein
MTESEWKVLEEYVAATAQTMGLGAWSITVKRNPSKPGTGAECGWIYGRSKGHITVASDFRTDPAEDQRYFIAHELLHLIYANAWDTVEEDLANSEALGKLAYTMFYESFKRQMEYSIDATATALAQFLPLIPWGSDGGAPPVAPTEEPAP